jgi:MFS family permease
MRNNIASNLWKIYAYKLLSDFYLIVPILIPYYKSHGLSATQVFLIQAAYALFVLILEIPSGYLADVLGRRATLIVGAAVFPIGLFTYFMGRGFLAFVLAEFIIAVANSMRSGCDSAIIYDTLAELERTEEYTKFEGRSFFYSRLGTSAASIAGGLLALFTLRLPFLINIMTASLMLPVALSLIEPRRKKLESGNPLKDILRISRFSLAHKDLRLYIFMGALIMSTGIIGLWSFFLYYRDLGISVGVVGVLFALFQLSSALGSRQAHKAARSLGEHKTLMVVLILPITLILLGFFKTLVLIPLIILYAFAWGLSYPVILTALNRFITSDVRATVLSVANMTGSLAYVILAPVFGRIVDATSLSGAYWILGANFLVFGPLLLFLIRRRSRRRRP